MTQIQRIINNIAQTNTSDLLFNPFKDICHIHDLPNAPEIRQGNLKLLLETHVKLKTDIVWLFEAPSYLGARRSGAPFVNEGMYTELSKYLEVEGTFTKATHTDTKTAMTSRLSWKAAKELGLKPLMWEALPFHPHKENEPFTNRKPTGSELKKYIHHLEAVLDLIQPKHIVAVGRSAESTLSSVGIDAVYVRHPANGGYREFVKGIGLLYR